MKSIKNISFVIFSLIALSVNGQKIQIGLNFNPNRSYCAYGGQDIYTKQFETPKFGFDGGVTVKYVKDKLKIGAGFFYSRKGYALPPLVDLTGSPVSGEMKINFNYLEIPVFLNYSVIQKSFFEFYGLLGYSNNFLISNDLEPEFSPYSMRVKKVYSPGVIAGIGVSFHLSDKLFFNIEPTGKYLFSGAYKKTSSDSFQRKFYSIGVNMVFGVKI